MKKFLENLEYKLIMLPKWAYIAVFAIPLSFMISGMIRVLISIFSMGYAGEILIFVLLMILGHYLYGEETDD